MQSIPLLLFLFSHKFRSLVALFHAAGVVGFFLDGCVCFSLDFLLQFRGEAFQRVSWIYMYFLV